MNFMKMFDPSIFVPNNIWGTILIVLGGLGLFLYGINLMSDSLKSLAGNRLKSLVAKATDNTLKGILTGLIVTIIIQSSSATTVITISLISAGLMNLKQAVGVMMGANIGTTVTAFLIGLRISDYAYLIIVIGSILALFFVSRKYRHSGEILLGFGLLFVGLELMGVGLVPIKNEPWFTSSMVTMSKNPLLGVLIGTALTALIQSSSASIGILQQLFSTGTVPLQAAIPILFGCNIGTTVTALLASLGTTTEAKQASLFHILFNVIGSILFLFLLRPYVSLFEWVETNITSATNKLTIAYAHSFFNIATTLLVVFLIGYLIKIIKRILPAKKDDFLTLADKLNVDLLIESPVLALESARTAILEMHELSLKMFKLCLQYLNDNKETYFKNVLEYEDRVDYYNHIIHDYLMQMQSANLSLKESSRQVIYLDTIQDVERIADHCMNLAEFMQSRYEMNSVMPHKMNENLNAFYEKVQSQIENSFLCFKNNDLKLAHLVVKTEAEIDLLERQYRTEQLRSVGAGIVDTNDIHFVDILSNLERISDHCNNIAQNIIDPHYLSKERENPTV